jgi:hypothetical protein
MEHKAHTHATHRLFVLVNANFESLLGHGFDDLGRPESFRRVRHPYLNALHHTKPHVKLFERKRKAEKKEEKERAMKMKMKEIDTGVSRLWSVCMSSTTAPD